jgi:hypothetical protein
MVFFPASSLIIAAPKIIIELALAVRVSRKTECRTRQTCAQDFRPVYVHIPSLFSAHSVRKYYTAESKQQHPDKYKRYPPLSLRQEKKA